MSMAAMGRALQKRGYVFTILQTEEAEPVATREGMQFLRIPHEETAEDRRQRLDDLSRERGVSIRGSKRVLVQNARLVCEGAPELLRQADPDLLLADQSEPGRASSPMPRRFRS
jgi:UDP:flavonoid glycosyltransferase YjiC (YdhE family)